MQEVKQRNRVKCCLEVFRTPTADSTELREHAPPVAAPPAAPRPRAFHTPEGMPSLPSISGTSLVTTERTQAQRHSHQQGTQMCPSHEDLAQTRPPTPGTDIHGGL